MQLFVKDDGVMESTESTALGILPKKTWNVWSSKSRARVARDEAKLEYEKLNLKAKQDKVDAEIF